MAVNAEIGEASGDEFDFDAVGELLDEGERFHRYADDAGWFGSKLVKKAKAAVKSAVKAIAKRDPFTAAIKAVASGQNLGRAMLATARQIGNDAKAIAPYASTIAAMVPGVGTGVAAAISAGAALAQGKGLSQSLLAGVRGALPGGPLAAAAFDAGLSLAKGGSLTNAAIGAARAALPGGEAAKQAFDAAVAVAHGQSLQRVALNAATAALPGGPAGDAARALASQIDRGVPLLDAVKATGSAAAVQALQAQIGEHVPSDLRNVGDVARSLVARPELHGLTPAPLAAEMGVSIGDARKAMALAIAKIGRIGGPRFGAAGYDDAGSILRRVGPRTTFDGMLPHFASRMAPIAHSPSPTLHHTARRYHGRHPRFGAGALPAAGITGGGTQWLVESGDYPAKIAQSVTGSASRYPELLDANPDKPQVKTYKIGDQTVSYDANAPAPPAGDSQVVYQGRNFKSLVPGETLKLPTSWISTPAPAPKPLPPTPTPEVGGASVVTTLSEPELAGLKTSLRTWGTREGGLVPSDYCGATPAGVADLMPPIGWTGRDSQATQSFQAWANAKRSAGLRTDGIMDAATYNALASYMTAAATTAPTTTPATPAPAPLPIPTPKAPTTPTNVPTSTPPLVVSANTPAPMPKTAAQIAQQKKDDSLPILAMIGLGLKVAGAF